uniref:Putative secreted protein n=1 Tax=Amblyomma cajennense TaxID=34607 RepID=A0A023FFV7_AMBCJ
MPPAKLLSFTLLVLTIVMMIGVYSVSAYSGHFFDEAIYQCYPRVDCFRHKDGWQSCPAHLPGAQCIPNRRFNERGFASGVCFCRGR